jgi:hypothetical protein
MNLLESISLFLLLMVIPVSGIGQQKKYKPVKVPMIPGLRGLADKVLLRLVEPHLEDAGGDMLLAADLASESFMGASNYATALGNGRLSVEISPWAELTAFRWPNPTYSDQLRYFTQSNTMIPAKPVRVGLDEPSPDWRRYSRPIEPCPGLGSKGGFSLESGEVVWSNDRSWITQRWFEPEDSTVLITRLIRPDMEVEVSDWIDPDHDFMIRNYKINGQVNRFFYHATFAPWMAGPGLFHQSDPKEAGYAAIYSPMDDVIIHFKSKEITSLNDDLPFFNFDDLDEPFPEGGIFVAWGLFDKSSGSEVGFDRCPTKELKNVPPGALADAIDGRLKGSPFFVGPVDAGLSSELVTDSENTVSVIISVADSASGAVSMIREAREMGVSSLRERSENYWDEISRRIIFPDQVDPISTRVSHRSVLNLIQGQDREGGAIVASISRQPAYHFDWPRDGAFFDLTLDLAGFPEKVTHHHEFYKRVQYKERFGFSPMRLANFQLPFYKPAGHWPSNMAADGTNGSIPKILPFEIDETTLLVWDFWRHERALPEADREPYINMMRETMGLAADALLDYVDIKKGWTRPAVEDDNFPPDATLHGVSSVLTGLASACDAGPRWGFSKGRMDKWCEGGRALRDGVRGRIMLKETREQRAGWRGLSWSLWPAPVFDDYDEPGARIIKETLAESIEKKVNKEVPGFAYLGEEVFILALADRERNEYRDLLERALKLLTHEVAFPGTDCYGEVTLWGDFAGTGELVAQQRTSIPHIWNGATVYLSAIAIYEPERFDIMKPPAP